MADNTQLNPGSGGDLIKTEDLGLYKLAVSKIYLGAHGVDGGPVSPSNPLPVNITNFPAAQALPAGAAVASKQPAPGTAGTSSADVLTVQGIASMTPLKVDGSAATQPVSGSVSVVNFPAAQAVTAAALPLPAGAAVASKQPAPGTAGTSSTDVLTVQGIASMTPLKVDGSAATQPVSGSVSVANFPATQPVSVAGTVSTTANLNVAGSAVAVGNPIPVTNVAALPPGTNTIGAVISQLATGVLYSGTTALTPKFASISASAVGDNTLVAAVSGKKLRVLKYTIVASGAISAKFRSSSGTDLTGAMSLATNSGIGGAFCPVGLFESIAGDGLILNLSAATAVAGHLTYVEI